MCNYPSLASAALQTSLSVPVRFVQICSKLIISHTGSQTLKLFPAADLTGLVLAMLSMTWSAVTMPSVAGDTSPYSLSRI